MSFDKPTEYWVRMGEIGELIASDTFSRIMQERYGRVQLIVNGHDELHKSDLYPIDNYDEDAHHLDLVAADMRANLKYWVYGIAEVKSTLSKSKTEFALNGMCPHYLWAAVRAGIPIYLLVVRFPRPLPDDILTDEGSVRAFMEFKELVTVEVYPPGTFHFTDQAITINPSGTTTTQTAPPESDDDLLKRLLSEANSYED